MNDAVKSSLEAARNAAASIPAGNYVPPAAGSVPTAFQPQAGAVVTAGPRGHKLAVSTMQKSGGNSLSVDHFLAVKTHGVIINFPNDDPRKNTLGMIALKPLVLLVDYATDVAPKYSVRAGVGQAIKFYHSYDRVYLDDGVTPWESVINKCKQADPKCRGDYPSIDISGVLIEPAISITGVEVLPAGKRVGFSTSVMNWQEYQQLHQQLVANDIVAEYDDNTMEGKVVLQITGFVKTNKGGIQYGAYNFAFLGKGDGVVVPNAPAQAASQPAPQVVTAPQPIAANAQYTAPAGNVTDVQSQPAAVTQPTAAGTIPGVAAGLDVSGTPKRSRVKAATA